MEIIDTHTHVFLEEFDPDRADVIGNALNNNIVQMVMPNIDLGTTDAIFATNSHFPACKIAVGLHPCSVKAGFEAELAQLYTRLNHPAVVAVGETGLDLYWDKSTLPWQVESLKVQIGWALETKKPIILHVRESFNEIFAVLDEINEPTLTGVFHCFTGGPAEAAKVLSYPGFSMGIGGVITYKNSDLRETIKHVPKERIVLETDAPYLAPVPHRGKRNEPAFIVQVLEAVAAAWHITPEETAAITTANARKLFSI